MNARLRLILIIGILLFLSLTTLAAPIPQTPNVPGSLCTQSDPDFETLRYDTKVPYCKRNVTEARKAKIYESYGIPVEERSQYTIDHIIPLAIGGSNHDDNLWPEHHKTIKLCRANLEVILFKDLRDNKITQSEAIEIVLRVKFHDICYQHN